MENRAGIAQAVIGVFFVAAGFFIMMHIIKKITNKAYKYGSRVTEEDICNNEPRIEKKPEGISNDG